MDLVKAEQAVMSMLAHRGCYDVRACVSRGNSSKDLCYSGKDSDLNVVDGQGFLELLKLHNHYTTNVQLKFF